MKRTFRIVAISTLLLATGLVLPGCATMAQSGAMSRARRAMAHGKYEFALERLANAEGYTAPGPSLQAEIAFLRAECLQNLGRLRDAIATYHFVAEKFPDTEFGYRSRARLGQLEPPMTTP